jgi:hypothetical protein
VAPPEIGGVDQPGAYVDGVDPASIEIDDPGVRSLGGYALGRSGETHALVTNAHGRGRGIFFNAGLEKYPHDRAGEAGRSIRRLAGNALELAQIEPSIRVLVDGRRLDGCACVTWRLEETLVFVVSRDGGLGPAVAEAELAFNRTGYCYDVLDGVLLGFGKRIRAKIPRGTRVFALLPYDVEAISVIASDTPDGLRFQLTVETSSHQAWTHVVRQVVRDERHEPVARTDVTYVASRGVARGEVAFAANEPAGEYALVLRDVLTGVESELTLTRQASDLAKQFPVAGR